MSSLLNHLLIISCIVCQLTFAIKIRRTFTGDTYSGGECTYPTCECQQLGGTYASIDGGKIGCISFGQIADCSLGYQETDVQGSPVILPIESNICAANDAHIANIHVWNMDNDGVGFFTNIWNTSLIGSITLYSGQIQIRLDADQFWDSLLLKISVRCGTLLQCVLIKFYGKERYYIQSVKVPYMLDNGLWPEYNSRNMMTTGERYVSRDPLDSKNPNLLVETPERPTQKTTTTKTTENISRKTPNNNVKNTDSGPKPEIILPSDLPPVQASTQEENKKSTINTNLVIILSTLLAFFTFLFFICLIYVIHQRRSKENNNRQKHYITQELLVENEQPTETYKQTEGYEKVELEPENKQPKETIISTDSGNHVNIHYASVNGKTEEGMEYSV